MKLKSKRIKLKYQPGEEIFTFPEETGLPFIFDVEDELTEEPEIMDIVGQALDEAESLTQKAKETLKKALANKNHADHDTVTYFMQFHRDELEPDTVAELFPGTDPTKLSFAEMVDFLTLQRLAGCVDEETEQPAITLDLSFNPEITDELMVIHFDLNGEIFCITHES